MTGIQLEGVGPVASILRFLETLGTLGYPLVTESIQMSPMPAGPAQVKMGMTLLILDYEKWTVGERRPDA